jgi:predicted dehydrogenase
MSGNQPQLRGAVIGTGYFSRFHFDAWSRIPEVKLIACCDLDLDRARSLATEFDVPHAFDDYRRMLDEVAQGPEKLDFVDIVTRPDTHKAIVQEVADRGLAMICQKQLAPTANEAAEIVALTESASVPFMVHENFRFQPWYREIKKLLQTGVVGNQLLTLSARIRMGDGWGEDAYLDRQPYFQTMDKLLIFESGIHTIDTFRFLGGEIDRVWCSLRKLNPVIAGEDTGVAVMDFVDGGQGIYDSSRFNESTADNPRYTFGELLVDCDGGSLRLHHDGGITIQPLGQTERKHPYSPSTHGFAGDCVHAAQRHFVDGLVSGDHRFETDGPSYLKSIAVQEAMYRSAKSGTWENP